MLRFICLLLASLMLLPALDAGGVKDVRVLFVVAGHGGETKAPILEKLFKDMGGFELTRLPSLPELAKVKPGDYDVMLFYGGPQTQELQERAIQNFVEAGGGVVALHHASANSSTAWIQLIGGRFAGHPAMSDVEIVVADSKHPIMQGVEGRFKIYDEAYRHKMADVKREVLAKLKEFNNPATNLDIIWTRDVGKGRVVYNALGHGKEAWTNPNWQRLVAQSVLWAAGKPRAVKLP
jgi:type 1 glutamine amidotransferase